jgi:chaperone BCS1
MQVKERSIVLLEDIDTIVAGRKMQGDVGVSFSGLLNALDGVASRPGIITVLTTNHFEKLDPALIRTGRIDYRQHFAAATAEQVRRYVRHFYGRPVPADYLEYLTHEFTGRAMSDLQSWLLVHKHDDPMVRTAGLPTKRCEAFAQ